MHDLDILFTILGLIVVPVSLKSYMKIITDTGGEIATNLELNMFEVMQWII